MATETDSATPDGEPAERTWTTRSHPVAEDMRLQRVTWRIERAGWAVLALLLAAGLLGLFGGGPLSSATATGAGGRLEVSYGRLERNGAATRLHLQVRAGAGEAVELRLNSAFLQGFTIEAVHPQPAEERATADGAALVFSVADGAPLRVLFTLRPEKSWLVRSEIALAGQPPARFAQFIFP